MSDSILDADINSLLRRGYAELETALGEENVAERQLAFCQAKVARLSQKIIQLAIASDDHKLISAVKETGLTDAIRSVLKAADKPLSAPGIRTRLEQIGYEVSAYQNFLATLYLTLQRLEKQKEVYEIKHEGKKVYIWQFARADNPLSDALRIRGLPSFQERFMQGQKKPTRAQERKAREQEGLAEALRRFAPPKRNEFKDAAERLGLVRKDSTERDKRN